MELTGVSGCLHHSTYLLNQDDTNIPQPLVNGVCTSELMLVLMSYLIEVHIINLLVIICMAVQG